MPKLTLETAPTNLQGALPPNSGAGRQYRIDMIVSAIQYHENGDDTDPACCTGDNPCQTRIALIQQQRELAEQTISDRETQTRQQTEQRITTPGPSASGRIVSDPATPAQVSYIKRLVQERDASKIGTFPARTLAEVQQGLEVSKARASSLITALRNAVQIRTASLPTDRQMSLIRTMCAEQGREIPTDLTLEGASALISELIGVRETRISAPKAQTSKVAEDGMYQTPDGTIYKVQIAKQGSGNLYAKRLTQYEDKSWGFEFERGAIYRLTAEMKMTLEQAQEFGQLYGVCCKCGADLTDEVSIERGIGPVCAGKWR